MTTSPLLFLSLAFSLTSILPPAASYWGGKQPKLPSFHDRKFPTVFHECLNSNSPVSSQIPSSTIYAPSINSTAFTLLLNSTAQNLRCLAPTLPKPVLIFTPLLETQVPPAVNCVLQYFLRSKLKLRIRSGGHDYEGFSYTSLIPNEQFVLLDLQFLRDINVTVDRNRKGGIAWVQAGITTGELYHKVAEASRGALGFPGGLCMTLGIGGHLTGGAYGAMMRAHGLGVDHALDARMVLANGSLVDSVLRDKELFWAITGGGGGNFGVILAWKLSLVPVPRKVTAFMAMRPLNQMGLDLLNQWQQEGYQMDKKAFVRVLMQDSLSLYNGIYLGRWKELRRAMNSRLPQLRLDKKECAEMTWLESMVYIGGYTNWSDTNILLTRKPSFLNAFKAKSDFLTDTVSSDGLQQLLNLLKQNQALLVIWNPFGGKMANVTEDQTPFPHRKARGMIQYVLNWQTSDGPVNQTKNMDFMRILYQKMEPYIVTKDQIREAYVNYKDVEIGKPSACKSNISCPSLWGPKYYKGNFDRLISVKSKVDKWNFFSFEQSIPPYKFWPEKCLQLV